MIPNPPAHLVATACLLGDGGNQDWCHATDRLAFDRKDAAGTHQLWTCAPDGTGAVCLSGAARPGGPRVDRHKVLPTWHASGRWLVVQAENDRHPAVRNRGAWTAELVINGMATELYAVSADGQRWVRLTHSTWPDTYGHMSAHFSPDGARLTWAKLVEPAGKGVPWGRFRLMVADFVADAPDGVPSLTNAKDVTPPGAVFIEPHGFHPTENRLLYSGYHHGGDPQAYDLGELDLDTGGDRRLTDHPYWDEHAAYSPDGRTIAYMAGELGVAPMTADLMLVDADGANPRRLTAFNHRGAPGHTGERTMVMRPTWNADGTRLAATEQLKLGYPARRRLWVVRLAGEAP